MGLPVIGSIMEGYRTSDTLKRQRDEMRVGVDLQNRATALAGRKAIGSYVSDVGASGADLTLDEIGQANKEYALDIAIAEDYKKRQGQILDAEADYAIKQGWMDAAGEAISIGASLYTGGAAGAAGAATSTTNQQYGQSLIDSTNNPYGANVAGLQTKPNYGLRLSDNFRKKPVDYGVRLR